MSCAWAVWIVGRHQSGAASAKGQAQGAEAGYTISTRVAPDAPGAFGAPFRIAPAFARCAGKNPRIEDFFFGASSRSEEAQQCWATKASWEIPD